MAIPADQIGTIRISADTYNDETTVIPLRSGELTAAETQMWLSVD